MTSTAPHRFGSTLVPAALLAGALLVGCGGDDGPGRAARTPAEIAQELARETGGSGSSMAGDDSEPGEPGERVGTLVFFVPESVDAPAGYRILPNACDPEADDQHHGAYIRYAVPDDWVASGRGSSGSGGDLTGSVDHRFTTPGGEVWIDLGRETRDEQDRVLGDGDEPTESFDYLYSRGDDETRVVHSEAFTASIGGEDHQVWTVTDGSDLHAGDEAVYRVRVVAFHMTWPIDGSSTTSFVMELIGDPAVLDEDTVRTIVETVQVPDCVRHRVLVTNELTVSTDLDGDGRVATAEDLRAVLTD